MVYETRYVHETWSTEINHRGGDYRVYLFL